LRYYLAMRALGFRIFLLQFWLVWALLIVPAHTRGAIAIGGTTEPARAALLFDALPACCRGEKSGKEPARTADNCAICQIISHSTNPPALPVFEPKLEWLPWFFVAGVSEERGQGFYCTTRSRGPPASCLA
jgi:hypothetical protein